MRIVEVGQYFVTRDAGEFQQTVACLEYTLPRDDKACKVNVMEDIDAVPSNVQSARQEALFYVFEDNEAVINMII